MTIGFSRRDSDAVFNAGIGSSNLPGELLSQQTWHDLGQQSSLQTRLERVLAGLIQSDSTDRLPPLQLVPQPIQVASLHRPGQSGWYLPHVELVNIEPGGHATTGGISGRQQLLDAYLHPPSGLSPADLHAHNLSIARALLANPSNLTQETIAAITSHPTVELAQALCDSAGTLDARIAAALIRRLTSPTLPARAPELETAISGAVVKVLASNQDQQVLLAGLQYFASHPWPTGAEAGQVRTQSIAALLDIYKNVPANASASPDTGDLWHQAKTTLLLLARSAGSGEAIQAALSEAFRTGNAPLREQMLKDLQALPVDCLRSIFNARVPDLLSLARQGNIGAIEMLEKIALPPAANATPGAAWQALLDLRAGNQVAPAARTEVQAAAGAALIYGRLRAQAEANAPGAADLLQHIDAVRNAPEQSEHRHWLQQLTLQALGPANSDQTRQAQEILHRLSRLNDDCRAVVLQAVLAAYRPEHAHNLPFVTAVLLGENLPPRPNNSQQAADQFRQATEVLGQRIVDAAWLPEAQQRARGMGSIIDLLAITGAGSSSYAAVAARALMESNDRTHGLFARLRPLRAETISHLNALIADRNLSPEQASYLMNMAFYCVSMNYQGNSVPDYNHHPFGAAEATRLIQIANDVRLAGSSAPPADLAMLFGLHQAWRPTYARIAAGEQGEQARQALNRSPFLTAAEGNLGALGLTGPAHQQFDNLLTVLQSNNIAQIEQMLTGSNLAMLALQSAAKVDDMRAAVPVLLALANNTQLKPELRERVMQTLTSIAVNAFERQSTPLQTLLGPMQLQQNPAALEMLVRMSTGAQGSGASAERARTMLWQVCGQSAETKNRVLEMLLSPRFSQFDGTVLVAAILSDATTLPTSRSQAHQMLLQRATAGDQRALEYLLTRAASTAIHPGVTELVRTPDRHTTMTRVRIVAQSSGVLADRQAGQATNYRIDSQSSPDGGFSALLVDLRQRALGNNNNKWSTAIGGLSALAGSADLPRHLRQQALDVLVLAGRSHETLVLNCISPGSNVPQAQFEMWVALCCRLGTPNAMAKLAAMTGLQLPNLSPQQTGRAESTSGTYTVPARMYTAADIVEMLNQRLSSTGVSATLVERSIRALMAIAAENGLPAAARGQAAQALNLAVDGPYRDQIRLLLQSNAADTQNPVAFNLLNRALNQLTPREATTLLAQVTGTTLPAENALEALMRPIGAGSGQQQLDSGMTEILRGVSQRAQEGNPQALEQLTKFACSNNLPLSMRVWAAAQLSQAASSGHGSAVGDAVKAVWQTTHSPAAFELLASIAAQLPNRTDLRQLLAGGYNLLSDGTPGMSEAQRHSQRASAAMALLSNPQLLTPALVSEMVQHMTPELAAALASARQLPDQNARQFVTTLRQAMQSPGNLDASLLAQSMSSLSRFTSPADVAALAQLRANATATGAQAAEIDRALFAITSGATDLAARRASLTALSGSQLWSGLSAPMRTALTDFANTGVCSDLAQLRAACDRVFPAGTREYPLAVLLKQYGVPAGTTDAQLCTMARQMESFGTAGGARTRDNWVIPIMTAAMLAWEHNDPRATSYQGKEQFMLAVMQDLARGRLATNREFLTTYLESAGTGLRGLQTQRGQLVKQIEALQARLSGQSLAMAMGGWQQSQTNLQSAIRTDRTALGPQRSMVQGAQQEALRAFEGLQGNLGQGRQETFALLRQRQAELLRLDAQIAAQSLLAVEANHATLRAQGRQAEADNVLIQYMSLGTSSSTYLNRQLTEFWDRLKQMGLAPVDSLPNFGATNGYNQALTALGSMSVRPDIASLSPEARALHLRVVNALTDGCLAQAAQSPAVTQMSQFSQETALRMTTLMQQFELACQTDSQSLRNMLRMSIQTELQSILTSFSSLSPQAFMTVVQNLETARDHHPPGSLMYERLDQQIRSFRAFREGIRPGGALYSHLRDLQTKLASGVLDDNTWKEMLSTLAHVAVATAAFTLAAAVTAATCGAAAPAAMLIVAPVFTMAARHLTQEGLHQVGLQDHGSILADYFVRGNYNGGNGLDLGLALGQEFVQEAAFNALFCGTGRVFTAVGSRWAGGSFTQALLRTGGHANSGGLVNNFIRDFGFGVATAAPDMFGIEHGGTVAGLALAGWHGFQSGRRNPAHTLATLTNHTAITPAEMRLYEAELSRVSSQARQHVLDALGHVAPQNRMQVLQGVASLHSDIHAMQAHIDNPQQRARFLLRVLEMPAPQRQQLIAAHNQLPPADRGSFLTLVSAMSTPKAVENLLNSLQSLTTNSARSEFIARLKEAPPALVSAICEVMNPQDRTRLVDNLHELMRNAQFKTNFERTLGAHLTHEQRVALLESIARLNPPARMREIVTQLATDNGVKFADALASISEPARRNAILDSLAGMNQAKRALAIETIGGAGDRFSRVDLLRDIAVLPQNAQINIMETLAGNTTLAHEALTRLGETSARNRQQFLTHLAMAATPSAGERMLRNADNLARLATFLDAHPGLADANPLLRMESRARLREILEPLRTATGGTARDTVQRVVHELSTFAGVHEPTIEFSSSATTPAYDFKTHTLVIPEHLLDGRHGTELIGSLIHEFQHAEQMQLIVRHLATRVNPQQGDVVGQIQDLFTNNGDRARAPSADFINHILQNHQTPLTPVESARAAHLLQDFHGGGIEAQRALHANERTITAVDAVVDLMDTAPDQMQRRWLEMSQQERNRLLGALPENHRQTFLDWLANCPGWGDNDPRWQTLAENFSTIREHLTEENASLWLIYAHSLHEIEAHALESRVDNPYESRPLEIENTDNVLRLIFGEPDGLSGAAFDDDILASIARNNPIFQARRNPITGAHPSLAPFVEQLQAAQAALTNHPSLNAAERDLLMRSLRQALLDRPMAERAPLANQFMSMATADPNGFAERFAVWQRGGAHRAPLEMFFNTGITTRALEEHALLNRLPAAMRQQVEALRTQLNDQGFINLLRSPVGAIEQILLADPQQFNNIWKPGLQGGTLTPQSLNTYQSVMLQGERAQLGAQRTELRRQLADLRATVTGGSQAIGQILIGQLETQISHLTQQIETNLRQHQALASQQRMELQAQLAAAPQNVQLREQLQQAWTRERSLTIALYIESGLVPPTLPGSPFVLSNQNDVALQIQGRVTALSLTSVLGQMALNNNFPAALVISEAAGQPGGSHNADTNRIRLFAGEGVSGATEAGHNYNHEIGHALMNVHFNGLPPGVRLSVLDTYRRLLPDSPMGRLRQYSPDAWQILTSGEYSNAPALYHSCFPEMFAEMHALHRLNQQLGGNRTYEQLLQMRTMVYQRDRYNIMRAFEPLYQALRQQVFLPYDQSQAAPPTAATPH